MIEPSSKRRAGLQPPTFSLRRMLMLVAILAALLAFLSSLPAAVAALFLLVVAAIWAHVMGNALGTRLRDSADTARPQTAASKLATDFAREEFEPTTLSEKTSLGLPLVLATTCGGVVGGGGGYWGMLQAYGSDLPSGAVAIGIVAAVALGAFWGFWIWSLFHVALGAWWQAHSRTKR